MRLLFAFFLSLFLSVNAVYAAATDICDMVEHGSSHNGGAARSAAPDHFGHHSHDHAPAAVSDSEQGAPDQGSQSAHADLCHPHQCFTSVLPGQVSLPAVQGDSLLPLGPNDPFVSLAPSRLERPPRATLA